MRPGSPKTAVFQVCLMKHSFACNFENCFNDRTYLPTMVFIWYSIVGKYVRSLKPVWATACVSIIECGQVAICEHVVILSVKNVLPNKLLKVLLCEYLFTDMFLYDKRWLPKSVVCVETWLPFGVPFEHVFTEMCLYKLCMVDCLHACVLHDYEFTIM